MAAALAMLGTIAAYAGGSDKPPMPLTPSTMTRIGSVDERYLSFNIEMLEVTGGRFWKPYNQTQAAGAPTDPSQSHTPAGMNPNMYQYRPPIDFANAAQIAPPPELRSLHFNDSELAFQRSKVSA